MLKLAKKVAVITGGDQGIGRGIALRLAQEGADVAIGFRSNEQHADEVVRQIKSLGRRAVAIQVELTQMDRASHFIQSAADQLGTLDILVNNAGVEKNAPFWEVREEDYDLVLAVNLKSVFFLSQYFVKHLQAAKKPGKIINISSVHEELPFPNFAAYCASKGGMKMLTRNLAIELAPFNITVNGIAPGAIATPINTALLQDKAKLDALLQKIPLNRMGTPEDVAGVAAFLSSSDADYITGTTIFIDGGLLWNYHEQ